MLKLSGPKIEGHITDWLRENGHDELVAWAYCKQMSISSTAPGSHTQMTGSSADPKWAKQAMGFGDRENALVLGYAHAFVLTRSTFFVVHLTNFKTRPKRVWIEASAAPVRLHHMDAFAPRGHLVRYFALELPDGRLPSNDNPAPFILDSFVLRSKGGKPSPLAATSDTFIAAFGPNAHRIDPPAA